MGLPIDCVKKNGGFIPNCEKANHCRGNEEKTSNATSSTNYNVNWIAIHY